MELEREYRIVKGTEIRESGLEEYRSIKSLVTRARSWYLLSFSLEQQGFKLEALTRIHGQYRTKKEAVEALKHYQN